jgi:hypothetical protein
MWVQIAREVNHGGVFLENVRLREVEEGRVSSNGKKSVRTSPKKVSRENRTQTTKPRRVILEQIPPEQADKLGEAHRQFARRWIYACLSVDHQRRYAETVKLRLHSIGQLILDPA